MKKISQKEAIFYQLYRHFKSPKRDEYVPVFALMGEVWCEEAQKWGFVSYEVSARASEMIKENPGLIMRTWLTGRSGAKYYGYRITPDARPDLIKDPKVLAFYRQIVGKTTPLSEREQAVRIAKEAVRDFDKMP